MRYDHSCQLTLADVQGLGVTSLLLSVPHMATRHWRYDFVAAKPYLLCTVNNNMGAESRLAYRSSAQFWLDEKVAAVSQKQKIACGLPFPLHLLASTTQLDEITGNSLHQQATYYHGFYDGVEREFRGFGRVDTQDTHADAQGSAIERTPPSLSRSWFHTGRTEDESRYQAEYWHGDERAYALADSRFTSFNPLTESDDLLTATPPALRYWLARALKGSLLHSELYGLDNSGQDNVPYTTNSNRYQVRWVNSNEQMLPIVMPLPLEQLSYHYERIAQDPQCSQQIVMRSNIYGHPLHTVAINYPRRPQESVTPYSWLAADHWASSYDEQQQWLRLSESQQAYQNIVEERGLLLGLPWRQRSDVLTYAAEVVPVNGLSYEIVADKKTALGTPIEHDYAGQNELFYHPKYPLQGLVISSESAEFDALSLTALDTLFPNDKERDEQLTAAGYQLAPRLFAQAGESDVWVARRGLADYFDASHFYRPEKQRSSALVGDTQLHWDDTCCAVTTITLADGSTTHADYDYRFITPYLLTDINDNQHYIALDALGRVTSSRFWGTELHDDKVVESGFSQPSAKPFTAPTSIEAAIDAESDTLPVAQFSVYQPFSWMRKPHHAVVDEWLDELNNKQQGQNKLALTREILINSQFITEEGYLCALGSRRWLQQSQYRLSEFMTMEINSPWRSPPHAMTVVTDHYDRDTQTQQHQQLIVCSDGFGRTLQVAQRVDPGEAYLREEDGSLSHDSHGLTVATTEQRWAVSGRVEYDNKGLAVRAYQPYFLNDWRYISDDSARQDAYADTHSYDPLGRESQVITAKGYLRRTQYFPWFVISEDENDTAAEFIENKY